MPLVTLYAPGNIHDWSRIICDPLHSCAYPHYMNH